MALATIFSIQCFFIVLAVFSCIADCVKQGNLTLCANESVSCSPWFLKNTNATEADCRLLASRGDECKNKEFKTTSSFASLGSVKLSVYSYTEVLRFPGFNITFSDIKWTAMSFRFITLGGDIHFCRDYHISSKYSIPELYYDCLATPSTKEGYDFYFEYQAEDAEQRIDARKFILTVPLSRDFGRTVKLANYSPFLYVDITDLPVLVVYWQQVPFGTFRYRVEVFNLDSSEHKLIHSATVEGRNNSKEQLSYRYNVFPDSGKFYVKITVLNESCQVGLCGHSTSPQINISDTLTKTFVVGIVGCVVLIPLFMFILFMWRRQCRPPSQNVKKPVVLIIHTPSRASHLSSVIALTKYLRNHCFIDVLLDQLDIPITKSNNPWTWYNRAFSRADFVMIISSPPKCCNEEGIFRNMDRVALRFLQEKFSSCNSKSHFFAVILPYCTEKDLPEEAVNLRKFMLMKELDSMLWYIHNGGRFPSVIDSVRMLFGPKQHGGKSDLNTKGVSLLLILKEAKFDQGKVCNCADRKSKESEDETEDENTKFMKLLMPKLKVEESNSSVSVSGSLSCLLPETESVELFPDMSALDLLGEGEELPVVVVERTEATEAARQAGFSIHSLQL